MSLKTKRIVVTATSPATSSTVVGPIVRGFEHAHRITLIASITGGTGGSLNVYLQGTQDAGTNWHDVAHINAVGAGVSINRAVVLSRNSLVSPPTQIGTGTSVALANGVGLSAEFGHMFRFVFVAGGGTSAGASQTFMFYVEEIA